MQYLTFLIMILCFYAKAIACPVYQPLTREDTKQVHSVFIGKAIAYNASPAPDPVQITFRIEEIISGHEHLDDEITVNWIHGTFGEPDTLEEFRRIYGDKTKVGILLPHIFPEKCRMVEMVNGLGKSLGMQESCQSSFIGNSKTKNAWVLNKHCSGPFMQPLSH